MNLLKRLAKKIFRGSNTFTSSKLVEHLRSMGMTIGERVVFFNPNKVTIDQTRPWLVKIGDDVNIATGCTILTHGYDWCVLKRKYNEIIGSSGKVELGNNIFIGANTTILKGVTIGNNVIIGAGSVVTKDIPDDCVAAGNPCKVLMSLDEYYSKRKEKMLAEAKELVIEYRKKYGRDPTEDILSEFFFLFTNTTENLPDSWDKQMHNVGNYEATIDALAKNQPKYSSMQEFLKDV